MTITTDVDLPVVDHHTAIQALREVVAGHEDFVYQYVADETTSARCVYVHEGAPSCMVGHALARLGYPIEVLSIIDGTNESGASCLPEHLPSITTEAARVFNEAQVQQDCQKPWGLALEYAEDYYQNFLAE